MTRHLLRRAYTQLYYETADCNRYARATIFMILIAIPIWTTWYTVMFAFSLELSADIFQYPYRCEVTEADYQYSRYTGVYSTYLDYRCMLNMNVWDNDTLLRQTQIDSKEFTAGAAEGAYCYRSYNVTCYHIEHGVDMYASYSRAQAHIWFICRMIIITCTVLSIFLTAHFVFA